MISIRELLCNNLEYFIITKAFSIYQFLIIKLTLQYSEEVGQPFEQEVINSLHKQTAGQPFFVNRAARIMTEELDIPKTDVIEMEHFAKSFRQLLEERNANIEHLLTNIRRDRRFEKLLMKIASDSNKFGVSFNLDNEIIYELSMYGVIKKDSNRMCKIANPIYQHHIIQAF